MSKGSFYKLSFLKLILLVNFFLPTWNAIASPTGSFGFVILNATLCSLLLAHIIATLSLKLIKFNVFGKVFIIINLLLALQILISSFFNESVLSSDVFELIRPLFYFLSFHFGYFLIKNNVVDIDYLVNLIVKFIMFALVFGGVCLIFYSEFGSALMSFYVKEPLINSKRFVGTFMNPYDYALLISLCFSYYFVGYLNNGRASALISMAIVLAFMAISQSKNVFAAFLFSFFMVSLLYNFFIDKEFLRRRVVSNFKLLIIFFLISIAIFYVYLNFTSELAYLINGIEKLMEGSGDKSTNMRAEQFTVLFGKITESPIRLLTGFGSNKANELAFESLYSLYLFRYGVLGLIIICFYSIFPFYLSALKLDKKGVRLRTCLVLSVFFLSVLVAGVGNNIIDQARVSLPFFLLFGAVVAQSTTPNLLMSGKVINEK